MTRLPLAPGSLIHGEPRQCSGVITGGRCRFLRRGLLVWLLIGATGLAGCDSGARAGISSELAEKMKALEREVRELRQANEILRKASAYFALAELDRRSKI